MDAVVGQQQRDAEFGAGGEVDRGPHPLRRDVQQRPDLLAGDQVVQIALGIGLHDLADLLLQAHPGEQVLDPLGNRERRIAIAGHQPPPRVSALIANHTFPRSADPTALGGSRHECR